MFSKIQENQDSLTPTQIKAYDAHHAKATYLYNERYDNDLFKAAKKGLTDAQIDELIDAAEAICGSPWYTPSNDLPLTDEVLAFLDLFKDEVEDEMTDAERMHFALDAIQA
jgi:hypothetical protein